MAELRQLGFFAGDEDLSDEQLAAQIEASDLDDPDHPLGVARAAAARTSTQERSNAEIRVACQDPSRMWWQACTVDAKSEAYTQALRGWAEISRGAFDPCFIHERWQSDSGPVTITFQHGSHDCVLQPRGNVHHFDLTILGEVNKLLVSTGQSFAVRHNPGGQTLVIAVTADEYLRLNTRGWDLAMP